MNLKINLQFVEVKESKYRKNAALQIRQEVANVLKHAKLAEAASEEQKEETKEEQNKKGEKKPTENTQQKSGQKKAFEKKDFRVTIREVFAKTVIRMLYMEGILKEKP